MMSGFRKKKVVISIDKKLKVLQKVDVDELLASTANELSVSRITGQLMEKKSK